MEKIIEHINNTRQLMKEIGANIVAQDKSIEKLIANIEKLLALPPEYILYVTREATKSLKRAENIFEQGDYTDNIINILEHIDLTSYIDENANVLQAEIYVLLMRIMITIYLYQSLVVYFQTWEQYDNYVYYTTSLINEFVKLTDIQLLGEDATDNNAPTHPFSLNSIKEHLSSDE